ncbi:MAG TPA: glycoside hydrolase family 28 protein [Opitutaceae bacterium]|nr:glycoside hydrolase family 28 protein [Opitutaceae bacterium]
MENLHGKGGDFRVDTFGARPGTAGPCTVAIQRAIDAAAAAGGGVVSFPPGRYLTGAIFVKSHVELRVGRGVELVGVQDEAAYPEIWSRVAGIEMRWPSALINIYEQQDARITGGGVIDGQGEHWWNKYWGPDERGGMLREYDAKGLRWAVDYDCRRPRLVLIYNSSNIALEQLTLKRSPFWTVHVCYSRNVVVDGIVIRENLGPSSDGIDIDSSSDVLVKNCDVDCNDDAICLKAGRDADGLRVNRPTENIVIRDCIVHAGHGLFTIGSETAGGVRNVEVFNLQARGTWIGFSFKSARTRGGVVENISIHDIDMIEVPRPFRFTLNWMPTYSYPQMPPGWRGELPPHWKVLTAPVVPPERGIPEFRNISFKNVTVKRGKRTGGGATPSSSVAMHTPDPLASLAFDVEAHPEKPMRGLSWENVAIEAASAGLIRHARDWTMKNVVVSTPEGAPVAQEDCTNVPQPKAVKQPAPA